jgi:hypothetical protein
LDDALRFYRVGELLQGFGAHVDARLIFAFLQEVEREARQLFIG